MVHIKISPDIPQGMNYVVGWKSFRAQCEGPPWLGSLGLARDKRYMWAVVDPAHIIMQQKKVSKLLEPLLQFKYNGSRDAISFDAFFDQYLN